MNSLIEILKIGGPVLVVLLFLSFTCLSIIISRLIHFSTINKEKKITAREIFERLNTDGASKLLSYLRGFHSPQYAVAARIVELCIYEEGDANRYELERELELFAEEEVRKMSYGLDFVKLIAHLAPLLGLLGTVLGMISSFKNLNAQGSYADPSLLSGGIWEALVTTAGGLILAVPLIVVCHFLDSYVEKVIYQIEILSSSLLKSLKPVDEQFASEVSKLRTFSTLQ